MNKNTLIGSLLIAIIMIWWMSTMPKHKPAPVVPEKTVEKESSTSSLQLPSLDSNAPSLVASTPDLAPTEISVVSDLTDSSIGAESPEAPVQKPIVEQSVSVETDLFTVKLSNRGAKISSIVVKTLADEDGEFPELVEDTAAGLMELKLDKIHLGGVLFALDSKTPEKILVAQDTTVEFVYTDPNQNKVIRSYQFSKTGSKIKQSNRFEGFSPNDYELYWNGGMRETEAFPKGKNIGGNYFFSEVVFNNTYSVERKTVQEKTKFNVNEGKLLWAGLRRKYIAMTIEFPEASEATLIAEPLKGSKSDRNPGTYTLAISDYLKGSSTVDFDFQVLPLEWSRIKSLDKSYEKIIVSGWQWIGADTWFVALCGLLLSLLKVFYGIIPNYGVAIILLTILVRLLTTPLTIKQLRSTKEMGKLKPELDAINIKYRSEPQKKQAAIMELYAKNNINPMASCTGGCLPMLLQFPIFIGLFVTLGRAIELRGMPFIGWISDLSKSDVIWSGISIPFIMPSGLSILPIVMVITTYFQTKQSMASMTDPAQRKMMTWMMPGMMFVFSAVMPSGLVLYWIVSNLWGIGQYAIINKNKDCAAPLSKNMANASVKDAKIVKPKKKKKSN